MLPSTTASTCRLFCWAHPELILHDFGNAGGPILLLPWWRLLLLWRRVSAGIIVVGVPRLLVVPLLEILLQEIVLLLQGNLVVRRLVVDNQAAFHRPIGYRLLP